jgi:drug/metabolite transporter (DMT)-like permease
MRSWLLLFCCNLMWALQFTCIKLVQDQVGPMFTVWGPMTLAMLMLIPFVLRDHSRSTAQRPGRKVRTYLLLAGLGVFPAQVMMTWGTRMSLASNAALINLTLPVATAMFAVIFLRERMTPIRWVSFAVAIAGVVLCSGGDFRSMSFSTSYLAGNALIFAATLGSAFYNSYGKRALEFHSPMRMLFWTYVTVCSMMAPVVLAEEGTVFSRIPHFTMQTWIGMALLTFFHNYLSMILFLKALKNLDAIQAALSNYLITFFGLPIAAVWLREKLAPTAIAGGILVLASTLLITVWEEIRAARRSAVASNAASSANEFPGSV